MTIYTRKTLGFVLLLLMAVSVPAWAGRQSNYYRATKAFRAADGAVGAPSYTFFGDRNSGIYWIAADNIGIGVAGAKVLDISASGLSVTGDITASGSLVGSTVSTFADGTEATPGIRWTSDTNSGWYRIGSDNVGLSLGASLVVDYSTSGVAITGTVSSSGAATLASLVCTAAGTFGGGYGATGATISTAGVGQFNDALTTDSTMTALDVAVGGGYGSTGLTITNAGVVTTDGNVTTDATLDANLITNGNGTAAAPSYSFTTDTDSGVYRIGSDNVGIAVGGAKVVDVSASGAAVTGTLSASGAVTVNSLVCTTGATFGGGFGTTGTTISTAGVLQTDGIATLDGGLEVDSVFTVADATGVVVGTPTTTSGDAWKIDTTLVTTGTSLQIVAVDATTSGAFRYIELLGGNGTVEVWSVGEDGVMTITGTQVASNMVTITNNAATSGDHLTLVGDDDAMDSDTFFVIAKGGTSSATEVWSIGQGGIEEFNPTAEAAALNTITVSSILNTTGVPLYIEVDDDILDGGNIFLIDGGSSHDTDQFHIAEGGVVYTLGKVTATGGLDTGTGYAGTGVSLTAAGAGSFDALITGGLGLTISGADAALNAGMSMDSTVFVLTDATGVISSVPTTTDGSATTFDYSTLTTGNGLLLKADNDILNGGKVFNIFGGVSADTTQFNVAEGGVVYTLGKVTATGGLDTGTGYSGTGATLTAAGALSLDDAITLSDGETIDQSADGYINTAGILNPVAFQRDTVTNADGSETLAVATSGQLFVATKNDGTTTFSAPAPGATTVGCVWYVMQTEDQTMKITAVGGDDTDVFITKNSQDSDFAAFDQATEKIGSIAAIVGVSATKHLLVNMSDEGVTMTVTDTD